MTLRVHSFQFTVILLPMALLGLAGGLHAASTQTNSPPKTPATTQTNSAPNNAPITLSVFTMPNSPSDGRDPFYPDSTRIYKSTVAKTNQPSVASTSFLILKILSGPPGHRLATINTTTFGTGEEADVATAMGRVRVRCLEIRDESVLIDISGERRELHFGRGK
jgi:hypothetical protein